MAKRKAALTADAWRKLPATEQADYQPNDSGEVYVLDLEAAEGYGLDHMTASRAAMEKVQGSLEAERKANRAAQAKLAALNFDPDDGRKAIARVTELEKILEASEPSEKARLQRESALKQNEEKWQGEVKRLNDLIAERDTTLTSVNGELENHIVDNAVVSAIAAQKGRVKPLLGPVKSKVRVVKDEVTGKRVARVFNDDGETPRFSKRSGSNANTYMPIDEYVESLKTDPDFAPLFDGSGVSGSGSNGSAGRRSSSPHAISEQEARDNPRAFQKAYAAAEAAGQPLQIIAPSSN